MWMIIILAHLNAVRAHLQRGVSQNMKHPSGDGRLGSLLWFMCDVKTGAHCLSLGSTARFGGSCWCLSGFASLPCCLSLQVPPLLASSLVSLLLHFQMQLLQLLPTEIHAQTC